MKDFILSILAILVCSAFIAGMILTVALTLAFGVDLFKAVKAGRKLEKTNQDSTRCN